MQKIFPFSGLPGDVADEEDGDDDHKDDGEVRLPPQELARADVVVPAVQYSTVQYSAVQYLHPAHITIRKEITQIVT